MISHPGTKYSFLAVMAICLLTISCRHIDVYEKNTSIAHYKWQHNTRVTGSFIITDTSSAYNFYIVLRHLDAYKYNNIWLHAGLQAPADTMFFQNINLTLASDATGWEGSGMNDIWEVRKLLNGQPKRFKKTGEYKFNISHIMRDDPLPGIMSVGMRVQKAP